MQQTVFTSCLMLFYKQWSYALRSSIAETICLKYKDLFSHAMDCHQRTSWGDLGSFLPVHGLTFLEGREGETCRRHLWPAVHGPFLFFLFQALGFSSRYYIPGVSKMGVSAWAKKYLQNEKGCDHVSISWEVTISAWEVIKWEFHTEA